MNGNLRHDIDSKSRLVQWSTLEDTSTHVQFLNMDAHAPAKVSIYIVIQMLILIRGITGHIARMTNPSQLDLMLRNLRG